MISATSPVRDERNRDLARICFGAAGGIAFVTGCIAIGIGGLDARTFAPLLALGLGLYVASVFSSG